MMLLAEAAKDARSGSDGAFFVPAGCAKMSAVVGYITAMRPSPSQMNRKLVRLILWLFILKQRFINALAQALS